MESHRETGSTACFRGVKCDALPQLDQLAERADSHDTYRQTPTGECAQAGSAWISHSHINTHKFTHTCSQPRTPCSLLMVWITPRVAWWSLSEMRLRLCVCVCVCVCVCMCVRETLWQRQQQRQQQQPELMPPWMVCLITWPRDSF